MRKVSLSAFVVISFIFYALHKGIGGKLDTQAFSPDQAKAFPSTSPTPGAVSSPTPLGQPVSTPVSAPPTPKPSGQYRDGQYTGSSADAYYGNIQVAVSISGGKIADVTFLDYPHDRRTSVEINTQAMPYLKQEAIAAQSASVDIVSGASDSSRAFIQSLGSALAKART